MPKSLADETNMSNMPGQASSVMNFPQQVINYKIYAHDGKTSDVYRFQFTLINYRLYKSRYPRLVQLCESY